MNLFERAVRSCFRKPVKSILLLLVVCIISILFLSGMASRSANIAVNDSTRQAIGASDIFLRLKIYKPRPLNIYSLVIMLFHHKKLAISTYILVTSLRKPY